MTRAGRAVSKRLLSHPTFVLSSQKCSHAFLSVCLVASSTSSSLSSTDITPMGLLKGFGDCFGFRASRRPGRELVDLNPPPPQPDHLSRLPEPLIGLILGYVCPHSNDTSYEPSESCIPENTCSLCDLRDLASCSLVSQSFYVAVQAVLYKSVRIDAVHFCPREYDLAKMRDRRGIDPSTVVPTRLTLFERTAFARPDIAASVKFLKIPWMAREMVGTGLARTIAALPNLQYVDLPDRYFNADNNMRLLREEVDSRCWDMRRMKYAHGSEPNLKLLGNGNCFTHLQILELDEVDMDTARLRWVVSALKQLADLRLIGLRRLDDATFRSVPDFYDFPPLTKLSIERCRQVTSAGLCAYVSQPEISSKLESLSLRDTGVSVASLHEVLRHAQSLTYLSITDTVTESFPLEPTTPLSSSSLRKLNFEIITAESRFDSSPHHSSLADPYHSYLAISLLQGGMPNLQKLFVRDSGFATLLLSPPIPIVDQLAQARFSSLTTAPFNQPLELFTKGPEDSDWMTASIPSSLGTQRRTRDGTIRGKGLPPPPGRPVSAYMASKGSGPRWGGEARKSVIVGNGFGGALALPDDGEEEEEVSTVPILPKGWDENLTKNRFSRRL